MEDWYSPHEIIFSRPQVLWIIEHLALLKQGAWPPDPQPSSYVDLPLKKQGRSGAYFEVPVSIIAEVGWRLDETGIEGKLLVAQVESGVTDIMGLHPEARRALNYCSGWKRRRMGYSEWKKQRKYRGKMITNL